MTARPTGPNLNNPYWGALQPLLTALVEGVPNLLEDPASSRQVREATAALTVTFTTEIGPLIFSFRLCTQEVAARKLLEGGGSTAV